MGIYETAHKLSESGIEAALITRVRSAASIELEFIGPVQTFVNTGLALSYIVTYRTQLYNLGQYYNSFENS